MQKRENSDMFEFSNLRDNNFGVSVGGGCERMLQAAQRAHDEKWEVRKHAYCKGTGGEWEGELIATDRHS